MLQKVRKKNSVNDFETFTQNTTLIFMLLKVTTFLSLKKLIGKKEQKQNRLL